MKMVKELITTVAKEMVTMVMVMVKEMMMVISKRIIKKRVKIRMYGCIG